MPPFDAAARIAAIAHAVERVQAPYGRRYNPATGREDGAPKNTGWRGVIKTRDGVMTEVSVDTDGISYPLITPRTTDEDVRRIRAFMEAGGKPPQDLVEKAWEWARERRAAGKSPFFDGDDADRGLVKEYKETE